MRAHIPKLVIAHALLDKTMPSWATTHFLLKIECTPLINNKCTLLILINCTLLVSGRFSLPIPHICTLPNCMQGTLLENRDPLPLNSPNSMIKWQVVSMHWNTNINLHVVFIYKDPNPLLLSQSLFTLSWVHSLIIRIFLILGHKCVNSS